MKHFLLIFVLSILGFSCRPPNIVDVSPKNPDQPTKCVGGGCSVRYKITVTKEGRYERDPINDRYRDPTLDRPKDGDSPLEWLGRIFASPTTLPNPDFKPEAAPTNIKESGKDVVAGEDASPSPRPSFGPGDDVIYPKDAREEPKPTKFKNTELGKVWTGIENGVGQVYGEISGIRSRKSREAQAINRKIGEAKIIKEKVDLLLKEINNNSASIIAMAKDLSDPEQFTQTSEAFGLTRKFAEEHNNHLTEIYEETKDIYEEVEVPQARPIYDTPDLKSIEQARSYAQYAARKVEELPEGERETGRAFVSTGNRALDISEKSYRVGDKESGDFAKEIGIAFLDAALGFIPLVGWAKDGYEAISGTSLLNGDALNQVDRSIAILGVLTAGIGSKLAIISKGSKVVDVLAQSAKNAEEAEYVTKAGNAAIETLNSAKNSKLDVSVVSNVAGSSADAIRLRTQLKFMEDGILDTSGKITQQAAADSKILIRGSNLNNPSVINELTKDGSKISDWGKYSTKAVTTSNSQKLQVHYYRNDVTGAINYNIDFKINQVVQ